MNPDITTKLNRIKSALRESIEMANKATEGPWVTPTDESWDVWEKEGDEIGAHCIASCGPKRNYSRGMTSSLANAAFVAHARTMTPLACKALLTAIEGLENITCTEGVARNTLESITSEWPDV